MHTDSAKAYQLKIHNVHHTKVVHQKKKVAGKWIHPCFVKNVKLTILKKKGFFGRALRPSMAYGSS
eukprot:2836274-Amphidinium_carterae.2